MEEAVEDLLEALEGLVRTEELTRRNREDMREEEPAPS